MILAERLKSLGSPATELLGTRLIAFDLAAGTARFGFIGRFEFTNVLGGIQGGMIAAMLDETAGLTARLLDREALMVPTLDFRVAFFRPVPPGEVFGVGRAIRVGRRIGFVEADLVDHDDALLSRMSLTCLAERRAAST